MAPHATENGAANGASTAGLDFTTFSNVIDGKLSSTQKTRHGINPATGKPNYEVPVSAPEDVDRAMAAAKRACKPWAKTPYAERQKAVNAFADALEQEKDGFAKLLTQEQGKPLHFAYFELDFTLQIIRTMASLELPTEEIVDEAERKILVRYTPLGVTVGIAPWNYPVLLCCSKIAPCVVTGNPIIIKPSPFTPYGGLKVVELAQRFFPPGVVQALSGDDNLGPWLTAHPTPAKVSFTGSSATGKKVMESCSRTLKRVTLELGGNDPAVVLDDVNIDEVAPKIATLAFLNSGQICLALKRIFVHEKIYEQFRDKMVEYTKTLKVGEGFEKDVFLGPIQNSMQYERVKGFFEAIDKEKYEVAVGGKNPDGPGYFITPTIIDRPKEDSRIVVEEPFGPIVPLLTFSTDEEAIEKANNTPYGLGASVWSGDIERAAKVAQELEAGSVWVNTHFELDPRAPFGGFKESGIGTEFGVGGLKSYCNSQTLYLKKK
ncbi:NAD-dependent aldehyde dehydrogenase [Cladophialophora yegresii CBS 114405]|uniref:aldehyde dehydrogenase (NAD(+)) n=1 Tax=Cladophialophora yegresii CBS 114405 TaxID=1182544 RepID=W9VW46_9EURO|nr:NAD-dependent aldehyde dehydrogenase [Cladophialophora yegresii CBS 114405]EXJ59878.1 NAD-dependent aldehyde dehydrogenase [Cladophialophora yegresii CBS 114405]